MKRGDTLVEELTLDVLKASAAKKIYRGEEISLFPT